MRKLALTSVLFLAAIALIAYGTLPSAAQTTTTPTPLPQTSTQATAVPTTAGPANEVDAFFVACADAASLRFSGQMNANWDIFYQVFSGPDGTGTALTNLRQVQVDGSYTFNELIQYTGGGTVAAGATASMRGFVARETDPSRIDFEFTINDIQDGCTNQQIAPPVNAAAASVDAGAGSASGAASSGVAGVSTNILAPGDGVLNPNLRPEPDVVIGARTSDNFRSETPGLIFAECDAYPLALPGIVYDSDQITVFWSWFAGTQEELQQHIDNANYVVTLNTATFPIVQRSEPVRRNGNWWVFYTANVGNLRPGHYEVGFALTWNQPISDGYDDFGPGTENPRMTGLCNFDVRRNPENRSIVYTDMFQPTGGPVHNITPDD